MPAMLAEVSRRVGPLPKTMDALMPNMLPLLIPLITPIKIA